jgi:cellulose synthase/poly-beta-1,6-N-acetylglucosamine synthase-like glycosyltransferase
MDITTWAPAIVYYTQWVFMGYFILINTGYIMLNVLSISHIRTYMQSQYLSDLPHHYSGLEPPVSIIIPAYNERSSIVISVQSMLQLKYPEYELIIVNDGSKDDTLAVLRDAFDLVPFPEAYRNRIKTQPIGGIFRSRKHPNIRVIDKKNGGKADSLNAGINAARYALFCGVDADSILQRESLQRVVQPFIEDPTVIAAGGTVRIANGCEVKDGFLVRVGLPRNFLALIQIVEYLRAFLFGRTGWSAINGMLIISGAFGVFHRETVVAVGGYRTDCVGEDMELVVRLHRYLCDQKTKYRIVFVPDPICWTEAPEDLRTLRNQRIRWQRGLAESLMLNINLLFKRGSGSAGWLAFPFMAIFEWLGPLIEVLGYLVMTLAYLLNIISAEAFWVFLFVAIGFGILLSTTGLLLEEISFHIYPRRRHLIPLYIAIFAENLGYRQLNSVWRLIGLWRWLRRTKGHWGDMRRRVTWQRSDSLPTTSPD